jgi:hypothetical protein
MPHGAERVRMPRPRSHFAVLNLSARATTFSTNPFINIDWQLRAILSYKPRSSVTVSGGFVLLACQIRKLIVTVEMNFVGRPPVVGLKSAGLTLIGTTGLVYDPLADEWSLSRDTDVN